LGAYRVRARETHESVNVSATPTYKSRPDIFRIEGQLPGGYRLARPVSGEVWVEHGEYVADITELNLHAYGSTRDEALRNVRAAIVEQLLRLGQSDGRLSPIMKAEADRLRSVVAESHAHI
jgi:predicted RNase H-like HicB family nuclease